MILSLLSTETMALVQRSLDASALSHKAISNNIANVDTPGFKRSEVVFASKLREAFEARSRQGQRLEAARTDSGHLSFDAEPDPSSVQPMVVQMKHTTMRNDGNNVDVDNEMAKLEQNTILYNALAQITQQQFAGVRSAIFEGRR